MSSLNISYFYFLIYDFFVAGAWRNWLETLTSIWFYLRLVSLFLSLGLLILVIYLIYQIVILRREENSGLRQMLLVAAKTTHPDINPAWQNILAHLAAPNSAEWKLAIIEADKMLDALVKGMQYPGETLGERLQKIEPSDFATLQDAWAAHKIRNRIAHEPDYQLSEREARAAIAHYQAVFEEFKII